MKKAKKLSGLVYVKHGRIGTKSEGPDYFLQTRGAHHDERVYELHWQDRNLWEPDFYLEFWVRRMVDVYGDVNKDEVHVHRIEPILSSVLPKSAAHDS